MTETMDNLEATLLERCHPSCRSCVHECLLLQQLNVNGRGLVEWKQSGGDPRIAFSCPTCDLCAVACNRRLDPGGLLKAWRQLPPANGDQSPAQHSLRQTDRPDHLYVRYRQRYAAEEPFPEIGPARVSFFPGCAMSAFTPHQARVAFAHLQKSLPDIGWLEGCCYDPLDKLGLVDRFETSGQRLHKRIASLGIEEIITACPTCTYRLQALLPKVQVTSIYEWMAREQTLSFKDGAGLAIHDACPDRFTQRIGKAVRSLLGVTGQVMKHEGKRSLCCGAGGDVPYFNPSLAQAMAERRLAKAEAGNARILVTYCTTCAVQLAGHSETLPIVHTLDLILGLESDYRQIAEQVSHLVVSQIQVSTKVRFPSRGRPH
jgi:Fe-S oxidoreductase